MKLLIFAGTTEGRRLCERALARGCRVTAAVATEYGGALLPHDARLTVHTGRMDARAMAEHLRGACYDAVVDATHPYAVEVSRNLRAACAETGARYVRLLRAESRAEGCVYLPSLAEACAAADDTEGAVLAATGSKEIAAYTAIRGWRERVYARVLPTEESLALCAAAGLDARHILAGKGPFSYEENARVMRQYEIRLMITKDGGAEGGFLDKVRAAHDCGAAVFVVARPSETGYSYDEVARMVEEGF
ncbi:MAG: precorrin-6x reductase [Clostridium sp. SCN 57-10]|nr:MAG: precorrin-6x reductase [Clostridium sp. SCN 57-10]